MIHDEDFKDLLRTILVITNDFGCNCAQHERDLNAPESLNLAAAFTYQKNMFNVGESILIVFNIFEVTMHNCLFIFIRQNSYTVF